MACEIIFACRGVEHGGNAVEGASHVLLHPATNYKIDPGPPTQMFDAGALVTYYALGVEVYGVRDLALVALIGDAAAALDVLTFGSAGAEETLTVSAVYFDEVVGRKDVPAADEGGKIAPFGVRASVNFGAGETFAGVISAA